MLSDPVTLKRVGNMASAAHERSIIRGRVRKHQIRMTHNRGKSFWHGPNLRKFGLSLVISAMLLVMFAGTGIVFDRRSDDTPPAENSGNRIEISVQPGDTLWSIARLVSEPSDDVRQVVDEIRRLNNLESAVLRPGQRLIVPGKDERP